jgi:hypothetical protein
MAPRLASLAVGKGGRDVETDVVYIGAFSF